MDTNIYMEFDLSTVCVNATTFYRKQVKIEDNHLSV